MMRNICKFNGNTLKFEFFVFKSIYFIRGMNMIFKNYNIAK